MWRVNNDKLGGHTLGGRDVERRSEGMRAINRRLEDSGFG